MKESRRSIMRVWSSRIGWRIALSAFIAVLITEAAMLSVLLEFIRHDMPDNYQEIQEWGILFSIACALLVTLVIMAGMGAWLLKPLLYVRERLLTASNDPQGATVATVNFELTDEVGEILHAADYLIDQNAGSLQRLHAFAETQIHKLAYFDTLTDLPNRIYFVEKLKEQTRALLGQKRKFAVVALDLDHFKDVNDSMGHKVGDMILRNVGKRLQSSLPESALIARSGEDEFVVAIPIGDHENAAELAEQVANAVRNEPYSLFNETFQVRASVGYSTFPDDDEDAALVLKHAMTALNRAKEDGRGVIRAYTRDFEAAVQQRLQILRDLRLALENNELMLHYQPQFDLETKEIIGAEALLRWFDKRSNQYISPGIFVPIAESSGLVVPMGEWVARTAIAQNMEWQKAGYKPIRIAVNVSAAQFKTQDITSFIDKTLKKYGLAPHLLELEVTESAFMEDVDKTIQTLKRLSDMGIEIAIDDFGTGYSSLSYLRQFPIDRLKIDQSFIKNALINQDDAVITRTVIALAKSLNLRVIAEGVETSEHEEFLMREGCQEVQGYYYGRPVAPAEFVEKFLKNGAEKRA